MNVLPSISTASSILRNMLIVCGSFAELTIRKGLSVRGDAERMYAYVPVARLQPDIREN